MNKQEIFQAAKDFLDDKISHIRMLIDEARASNNDTKSSMGDKYETGREMLQQEINNLQLQLNEFEKAKLVLQSIQPKQHKAVGLGSLVQTESGMFFTAVSLGEISVNERRIFFISPQSPLAKAMWNKSENETFLMNGSSHQIQKIW